MEGIGGRVFVGVAAIDDDLTSGDGLFGFGKADLGDGDGGGDGHHGGGDEVLSWDTEVDVCGEDRACNSRET